MCWILMITIRPDTSCLNSAAKAICCVHISCPNASAEPVQWIGIHLYRLFFVLKRCQRQNRTEYFFLENTHFIMPFENGRLYIITILKFTRKLIHIPTNKYFSTFLFSDI